MHRGEGGLAVAVEARGRIRRDHEREDPTALGRLARGGSGHGRNTKSGENSTVVTFHSVLLRSCKANALGSHVCCQVFNGNVAGQTERASQCFRRSSVLTHGAIPGPSSTKGTAST